MPARVIDADLLSTAAEESVLVYREWLAERGVKWRDVHLVIDPGDGAACIVVTVDRWSDSVIRPIERYLHCTACRRKVTLACDEMSQRGRCASTVAYRLRTIPGPAPDLYHPVEPERRLQVLSEAELWVS